MTGTMKLPRRVFLRALAASLGALLLLPHRRLVAAMKGGEGSPLDAAIAEAFELDIQAMQCIGEAARRSGCAEKACTLAVDIVDCTGVTAQAFLAASPAERRHLMTRAIRKDFAAGRHMEVDGWILAATEVRICLMALS